MATRVSLGFATLSDTGLDNFAQGVIDRMTGCNFPYAARPDDRVRALGGSTGQSDWSEPSSHMAM